MTRRGDDEAERRAINEAMHRLLNGTPLRPSATLTIAGLAREAGYERHVLTHKHTDLRQTFLDLVQARQEAEHAEASRGIENDSAETIREMKEELTRANELNDSLSAQLAAAILRIEELERRVRRDRNSHLRSVD